jgi:hypothetical protein
MGLAFFVICAVCLLVALVAHVAMDRGEAQGVRRMRRVHEYTAPPIARHDADSNRDD